MMKTILIELTDLLINIKNYKPVKSVKMKEMHQ